MLLNQGIKSLQRPCGRGAQERLQVLGSDVLGSLSKLASQTEDTNAAQHDGKACFSKPQAKPAWEVPLLAPSTALARSAPGHPPQHLCSSAQQGTAWAWLRCGYLPRSLRVFLNSP